MIAKIGDLTLLTRVNFPKSAILSSQAAAWPCTQPARRAHAVVHAGNLVDPHRVAPHTDWVGIQVGSVHQGDGRPPAVVLINPKYPHNVGAAVRAASCYGIEQVWFTGDRVQLVGERRFRLPREERM